MATREKQSLLEVLRALERDGTRLSVEDFVAHIERATGYEATRHYRIGLLSAALVHRRHSDDTVTVEGAMAVDVDEFADPAWELPESVRQRQVAAPGVVVPVLDSKERAMIARQLAADAARCEAAGVHFNPPFLPPALRPPSQQVGWQDPFICAVTLETWEAPPPEPRVETTSTSDWKARIVKVDTVSGYRKAACAKWVEAWPSCISYDVRRADPDLWFAIKTLWTFGTLDQALACVVAYRARAD